MANHLVKRKLVWKGVSVLEGEIIDIAGDDLKDARIGLSLLPLDDKSVAKRNADKAKAKADGETLDEYRRMLASYGTSLPPDMGVEEARKLYERVSASQTTARKSL